MIRVFKLKYRQRKKVFRHSIELGQKKDLLAVKKRLLPKLMLQVKVLNITREMKIWEIPQPSK
jgi:hypothetical protein